MNFVGYIFGAEDSQRYIDWLETDTGRAALEIEKELLLRLWAPANPQRVLEVGCGIGSFLAWFSELGHQVTGLDPSPVAVNRARERLPERVILDKGYAEDLPYEDNAFDTVALITTLEFVDNPLEAMREAFRVARRQVLLGVLNKYSIPTGQRYLEGLWKRSIYQRARFFGVFELQRLVRKALLGSVPVCWRTCLALPMSTLRFFYFLERSKYFQWHPFGHFIGMRIDISYPVQTVQDPLFCDLPAGMGHAHFHGSCLRSPANANVRQPSCGSRV